ncbi:MAG: hypothetical protein KGI59_03405, partial [Patescibacteria group bacterium]|nr:hypothetical protein [Patescibacteria group bacterium]
AAESAISDISSRGKLPIVCGGTGFYVQALANNREYPDIDVDPDEQSMLESEPSENLLAELRRLDPRRAASMQTPSEAANRRHLARAILIARELGAVPAIDPADGSRSDRYDILLIGIRIPDDELKERIRRRLEARLDGGMIDEARRLHEDQPRGIGLSYERMNNLGLEYRYLAKFLRGEIPRERLTEILATKIWQYARRQKTWFKRDPRINWFAPTDLSAIRQSIETWLHSSAD